jgi:hypothetical protein
MDVDGVVGSKHLEKYVSLFVSLPTLSDRKSTPAHNTAYNTFAEITASTPIIHFIFPR